MMPSEQAALPELKEKLPACRAALFGSFAKGRSTAHSDVDLLVVCELIVYEWPPREDAFATVKKTIPVRGLEPHVYTLEDARDRLLGRMTRGGIVLFDRDKQNE